MSTLDLDDTSPTFSFERHEDGRMIFTMDADGTGVTVDLGGQQDTLEGFIAELEKLAGECRELLIDWQDMPDQEDGYVSFDRGAYHVTLSATALGSGFPSRDIAEYELVKGMEELRFYPNCWLEGERGGHDLLDLTRFTDEEGNLKPLEGAMFEPGELVRVPERLSDWSVWVVDGDYGTLGLMLHTSGDPSVTLFVEGDDREGIAIWGEEEEEDASWTSADAAVGNCTTEHPCPVRAMQGPGECEHTS